MNVNARLSKKTLIATSVASILLSGCGSDSSSSDSSSNGGTVQKDALISTLTLPAGDAECANGGLKVIAGYDDNENGTLEDNEHVSNKTICHDGTNNTQQEGSDIFNQALVSVALIAKTDSRCDAGGQLVTLGVDTNNNSILDNSEVQSSEVLCSIGADFAPSAIINSITANPAIVAAGAQTTLTATISNLQPNDKVTWYNENGDALTTTTPTQVTVQAGTTVGQEKYKLSIETTNDQGQTVLQTKEIIITVAEAPAPTQSVVLNSQQVFLPEGYTTSALTGDVTGTIIYAKPVATAAASARSSLPTPDNTELAGFVAERGALNGQTTAQEILVAGVGAFASELYGAKVVQTSLTTLENGDVNATYKITLRTGLKLTDILNTLINQVAVNKVGGTASALVPAASEVIQTEYQLDITTSYNKVADSAVITSTLVQNDKVVDYSDLIVSTTSESIQASKDATLQLQNDKFTALDQTTSKADFLFVIDNSGSMSDEQQAISDLTVAFTSTIQNAGVDFMVGTITTDSDELRGNGFTNDLVQIAKDFKPGTWGSGTERGIYYSELALKTGGTVELAGYPRSGASLSIVIMSDEPSQYKQYNTPEFDPNNNLFLDNGYRVYSIVDPSDAARSQYDDLATSTLGKTLNINVTSEYKAFVEVMAQNAGASSAGYKLSKAEAQHILSSSILVTVDGTKVDRNSSNGWQYYPLSESIVFTGTAIPAQGAEIVIAYQYVDDSK
ncbi:VWA domain-containing protein [Vibrio fortis]|nr:VWA domain-containing protein [Vibrio fortis]